MGEASKNQVKATKQPSKIKKVLAKRVNVTPSNKLKRDVKAPKWLRAIGDYFVGSYKELKKVQWPSRKATWSLTLAVIIFTAVIVLFIVALDYGFDALFKKVFL